MLPLIPLYLMTATLGLSLACMVTLLAPNLWHLIPALTTYGKTSFKIKDQPLLLRLIAVPKRWFAHFYLLAVLNAGGWLLFFYAISQNTASVPQWMPTVLEKMTGVRPHFNSTTTMAGLCCVFVHVYRRCYESLFVSVYSDSSMNVGHYIMGMLHYVILPLAIVCEAVGVASVKPVTDLSLWNLGLYQLCGVAVFLFCNWQQHVVVRQMARLRKTSDGLTSHYVHGICYGGWFNLVSCPHFFFEIGIYASLWIVLQGGYVFRYLFIFVLVNQTFAALINHTWYQKTFKKYPTHRKAIFPYVL